ncbi:MAG TPA: hypothetical protein VK469_18430, partial [Candidatus Kapabacteria bacterium]|nr:hypothetical protein [Candidatus Kapabacteria bacterium]
MCNRYSKLCLKISLCVTLILFFNLYIFAYLFGNGSGNGYCDGTPNPDCSLPPGLYSTDAGTGYDIEAYVQKGGGYFLSSHSSTLALLNQI